VGIVLEVLRLVVLAYILVLLGRLVFDWVQVFARDWRPRGVALVLAELVYSLTDPPLRALHRVIKPVRLGAVQLDLAFTVLFGLTWVLYILL
jgi:YggT family protein